MIDTLVDALVDFIGQDGCTDDQFDAWAVRLFAHQYAGNAPFRRFCQGRAITPRKVAGWRDLPAVPITAFKEATLSTAPIESCARVFMTSGTTRAETRGRHYHPTLAVYDRSMTCNFARRFMAPIVGTTPHHPSTSRMGRMGRAQRHPSCSRLPMAILFPPEHALPNSSLAHYLSLAVTHFGADASRHFVTTGGIDVDGFRAWLDAARSSGRPCAVLGASYSFVHVLDAFAVRGERFELPDGSRLLDTGGYKRQSRELPLSDFYDALSATFGVPRERCINMYGMTELSTQFYDDGNATLPAVKSGPHWIRSRTIDPLTGRDVADGERGVLVHCDLANFNSTAAILTEDVGRFVRGSRSSNADAGAGAAMVPPVPMFATARGGFELLGRVEGAEAKGCSLAVDEFLRARDASLRSAQRRDALPESTSADSRAAR